MPDDKTSFTLSGLNAYSEYMVNVWVVTEEHVKGQIATRNITTVAVSKCFLSFSIHNMNRSNTGVETKIITNGIHIYSN